MAAPSFVAAGSVVVASPASALELAATEAVTTSFALAG
jgi:hypothetical protein